MLLLTEGVKQMIGSITQSSPLLIYMVHERGDGHVSKKSLGKGWKKKKVQTRTKLEMNWRLFECASKNTYCKLDPPVTTKPMVPWLTRVLAVLCLKKKTSLVDLMILCCSALINVSLWHRSVTNLNESRLYFCVNVVLFQKKWLKWTYWERREEEEEKNS